MALSPYDLGCWWDVKHKTHHETAYPLTLYLKKKPLKSFANRADPDQAALVRAAWSGSTLFAYGNMIRYDPALVDLTFPISQLSLWYLHCTDQDLRSFITIWAMTYDFQQCGILTSVDSDEPVQLPFKRRHSKWYSVSSLAIIEYSRD